MRTGFWILLWLALAPGACGDGGPKSPAAKAVEETARKMCACKTEECVDKAYRELDGKLEKLARPQSKEDQRELDKANEKLRKCLARSCFL